VSGPRSNRHSPSYKAMLASVLALAVPKTDEDRLIIEAAAKALLSADERARERNKAYYEANAEKIKARAKTQRKSDPEQRRARYMNGVDHYREKGREYANKRRESGKAAAYAETLKVDGRSKQYQAKYKYGEFAEAAIVLSQLEQELKHKGT
jgi:hypothetical protein